MKDIWRVVIAALLLGCALSAHGQNTGVEETSPTRKLILSVQSLTGVPLAGMAFQVRAASDYTKELETGSGGTARTEVPAISLADLDLELLSEDWKVASIMGASSRSDRLIYFVQLYRAQPADMEVAERKAFINQLPAILAFQREQGVEIPGDAGTPHPLRLSALLNMSPGQMEPWGREKLTAAELKELEQRGDGKGEEETPSLSAKVVNQYGQPVARRVVELLGLEGTSADARIIRRGRTDSSGRIIFRNLDTGRFYRVQSSTGGDELSARGPIIKLEEEGERSLDPLVLRSTDRTLSGLVYYGAEPLPRARVEARRAGQPALATETNEYGYFELGPLVPGRVVVIVENPADEEIVELSAATGAAEILVPFEVLRMPLKEEEESEATEEAAE